MNSGAGLSNSEKDFLIVRYLVPILGCVAAVAIGIYVNSNRNLIVAVANLAGFIGFLIAVVSPRGGLYVLVLMAAYLDYLKRFLLLSSGGADMNDVVSVLSAAPLTASGLYLGVFVSRVIFKRCAWKERELKTLWIVLVAEAVILLSAWRDSFNNSLGPVLNLSVNAGAYLPLLLAMGLIFRDFDDIVRFFRFALFAFAPVAFYGIWQSLFGFTRLEYSYLMSGLTQTAGNLDDIHPRPFSTLNSPHAFAVSMGILFVLSLVLWEKNVRPKRDFLGLIERYVPPFLYFTASILSFGRAGWIVWFLGLFGLFAFRSRRQLTAFYGGFGLLFILLVLNAGWMYSNLGALQAVLPSRSVLVDQAFRVGTYSERLYGYQNMLSNPDLWTWFGNSSLTYEADKAVAQNEVVHDAIGQCLVSFGFVGLGAILIGTICALSWIHKRILNLSSREKTFAAGLLAVLVGTLGSGMLTGNHFTVYPLNFLFWATAGAVLAVAGPGESDAGEEQPDATAGTSHLTVPLDIFSPV